MRVARRISGSSLLVTLAFATVASTEAAAQTRVLDLTGSPTVTLEIPASSVSNGVELGGGAFLYLDRAEGALVAADLSAQTTRVLGRQGSGPREYTRPARVVSDGAGGALVPDLALRRALHVSPSGSIDDDVLISFDRARFNPATIRGVDPWGRFIHHTVDPSGGRDSLPIVRTDTARRDEHVVVWWPMAASRPGPTRRDASGVSTQDLRPASLWPARTAWVVLPDGTVALVRPNPYQIQFVRPDGRVQFGAAVPHHPVKVDDAFRRAVQRERGARIQRDQFPEELPPFEGLDDVIVSQNGEIWVGRMRVWDDSIPSYDVFDGIGRRTIVARLRPRSRIVGFGPGTIYVARQNADDGLWWIDRYAR